MWEQSGSTTFPRAGRTRRSRWTSPPRRSWSSLRRRMADARAASLAEQAGMLPPPRPLISDRRAVNGALVAYALIFSTFVLYPVFEVVRRSVSGPDGFTLQHFQTYFADPRTYRSLMNSLFVAGLSTVLTVSLAFGFAFVLTRTTIRGR